MSTPDALRILVVDLTGTFSDRRYAWPSYLDAGVRDADGTVLPSRDIAFSKAQIAAIRAAGDLTEIAVEASLPSHSILWQVDQIFLPGTPIMPTRTAGPDAGGEISHMRASVDGGLQIVTFNEDGDRGYDIAVTSGRHGGITIATDDYDGCVIVPAVAIDHVIDALTALRDGNKARIASAS